MTTPQTIRAGTPATITVNSQPPSNGETVQLFLLNTNGTTRLSSRTLDGQATFLLDRTLTQVAGQVALLARRGSAEGWGTLTIVPDETVEPVLALVGPRSIRADGEHWTMLTALPHDQFGNAVADGTPVTVRALHPMTAQPNQRAVADPLEVLSTTTDHLLAVVRIYGRTKAGRIDMAASAGRAHSPERTVLAVPGPPVAFGLIAEPGQRIADGRQLLTIATEALQDQFANPLLDGTAVTFLVTTPDGTTRTLPAQSIAGRATVQVQAPTSPGQLQIEALILNTPSRPLTLTFEAGIGVAPIAVRAIPSSDVLTLIAGPLLGPLGQYIPDGSAVSFTLRTVGNEQIAIQTMAPAAAGFATTVIRSRTLAAGRYTVHVTAGVGEGVITIELP